MFKKMTAAILAIAMIAAIWTVPSQASSFSDEPFFNVDFNSGSIDDIAGDVKGEEAYSGEVQRAEFVQDNALGRQVLRFHGQSALFYTGFDYSKIRSNFTMEAYVKVSDEQTEWGYIAGSYWNTDTKAGVCMAVNSLTEEGDTPYEDIVLGKNLRHSVIRGNGSACDTLSSWDSKKADNLWTHLVYVHDGVNEYFYEDGVLIKSRSAWLQSIPSIENDSDKAFRIGGYNRLSEYCTIMDCAYVRIYDSAASKKDIAKLYTNCINTATPSPTPTLTPTATPKPIPTPFFDVEFSTGTGFDLTGNFTVNQEAFKEVCNIQKDEELNRDVGVFYGRGGIPYNFNVREYDDYGGVDIWDLPRYFWSNVNITLEAYVNLYDVQKDMVFLEIMGEGLDLQQYNDGSNARVGFSAGVSEDAYTEQGQILPPEQWVHLLGTSDEKTNKFYFDGQLVYSIPRKDDFFVSQESNKLMIGDSIKEGTVFQGKIAFVRFYRGSVDDAVAATLYLAANSGTGPEVTPAPTGEPTPESQLIEYLPFYAEPRTVYEQGEPLDLSGVTVKYNGALRLVEDYTVIGYHPNALGPQIIKVKYKIDNKYFYCRFRVEVGGAVDYMKMVAKPAKCRYAYGEDFDTTGICVLVHYKDGREVTVDDNVRIGGYRPQIVGQQTVQAERYGVSTSNSFTIIVDRPSATAPTPAPKGEYLPLYSEPSKLVYEAGEELDLSGIKANYNNAPFEMSNYTITGFDSTTVGRQKVTVMYEINNTMYYSLFTVRVIPDKDFHVTEIWLASYPCKQHYVYGEAFDTTGIRILVCFSDGSSEYLNDGEGVELIGTDLDYTRSWQRIYACFKELPCDDVNYVFMDVMLKDLSDIHYSNLSSKPLKLVYELGEPLDLTGMKIYDGCPFTIRSIIGFDSSTVGKQTVTVIYDAPKLLYGTFYSTFEIEIRPVSAAAIGLAAKPAKLSYAYGEALDTAGLSVLVHYSDGTTGYVSEGLEITGYDAQSPGIQMLRVTYQGRTTDFSVKVNPVEIVSVAAIGLATKPAKLSYVYGEALDTAGLSVLVHYSDGTTGYVSEGLKVTGYDATTPGVQKLTVTYQGRATGFSVRVLNS